MIFLWGLPGDGPIAAVAAALERARAKFVFLDQHESLDWSVDLTVADSISGSLRHNREVLPLNKFRAAYLRPYDARQLSSLEGNYAALLHAQTLSEALLAWADIADARIVNRPAAMAPNNSKPFQSEQIRSFGFAVPETLITTDPDAALAFWEKHGAVIYKSVSSVRSIVSRITPAHRERLADVRWCPTQFQQCIPGADYRVHVVGTRVFASRIESTADDYRYAAQNGRMTAIKSAELPPEIEERCRKLAIGVNLPVAGIDLRCTPSDEWYCFEVNPSPGFTYYEAATGQPITKAIVGYLRGK